MRKIILLSDGLANVGVTDGDSLATLAAKGREQGIGTTTIGFGNDFDEALMTAMADAGGGAAHFAETPDAAPGIFTQELEGLTQVVAQNVSLEIRPHSSVQVVGVLNDYPQVAVSGGVQIQLGDAFAGERRRVVFELHVPHLAALGPVTVAELVLRYVAVGDEIVQHEVTIPVVANVVSAEEAATAIRDAEVREEVLILLSAKARDEAVFDASSGDFGAALARISTLKQELRATGSPRLAEEADALDLAETYLEPDVYAQGGRKNLHYDSWNRRRRNLS